METVIGKSAIKEKPKMFLTFEEAQHLREIIESAPWCTWNEGRNRSYNRFIKKLNRLEYEVTKEKSKR